jgi:hypothetical protein
MTAPALFRQSDVTRLIRGAMKAGLPEGAIRLTVAPDGTLSLVTQKPADNDDHPGDTWDDA